jgi:hypothetical protein
LQIVPPRESEGDHDPIGLPAEPYVAIEERAAIAQHEAGFPAAFALAFAQLQVAVPDGVDADHWWRAVSAMGALLDVCRETAAARLREQ